MTQRVHNEPVHDQSPSTPTHDLIMRLRGSTRQIAIVGVLGLLIAGTWALWPVGAASHVEIRSPMVPSSQVSSGHQAVPVIADSVFEAQLWREAPRPVAAGLAEPPPPRLQIQLLAISRLPDMRLAAFVYDPDLDSVATLHPSDIYRHHEVAVFSDRIVLRMVGANPHSFTLLLDSESLPPPTANE